MFCGGGGSSRGATMAGAEIVCGIDADPHAIAVYNDNFPGCGLVHTISDTSSPADLGITEPIDVILASPECTSHTCARGNRPPNELSKMTAMYTMRYIRHFLPRWVVIENVPHMRGWDRYDEFLGELEEMNYRITAQVLNASDFGVPQSRRRLFLLCEQGRTPTPIIPPAAPEATAACILDPKGTWPADLLNNGRRAQATLERAERAMHALPPGEDFLIVYYGSDAAGGWQSLDRPLRTLTTLDRFGLVRHSPEGPTLRMLQPPELQRAMGLPPAHRINMGTRRDRVRILGNGVCPPVMAAIIESLATDKLNDELPGQTERHETELCEIG